MIRYYPSSKTLTDQKTTGGQFVDRNGREYQGSYYLTYDGKVFSGPSPQVGPSEPLKRVEDFSSAPVLDFLDIPLKQKEDLAAKTNVSQNRGFGKPISYYPQPASEDYIRGYIIRYFTKKENEPGFITEISEEEYNSIINGTANYDIRLYQTTKILWKITGPLRSQRKSQYNIIPGIIDTNKRLTEEANKTFLGITEWIGGEYDKFARFDITV